MHFPRLRTLVLAVLVLVAALPAAAQGPPPDTGDADFSTYVALGDSITAGFISGGLIDEVQILGYPSLLFERATGAPATFFPLPTVSSPGIPSLLQLRSLRPLVIDRAPGMGFPTNLQFPAPYGNLAVPGATVGDLLRTRTDGGGLHDLILRGLGTQLEQALAVRPTFVTLWIGNNDALGAATSGVVIDGVTLTRPEDFERDLRAVVSALVGAGARMAIANVPAVTGIPFVTAIAPVVVDPTTGEPVRIGGATVPLIGPDGPLGAGDFVLLGAGAALARGDGIPVALGGSGRPLDDQDVLSAAEAATIDARVGAFNRVIAALAAETGSALVDANAIFRRIARDGLVRGGIEIDAEFLTGGLFSYDGVHPTPLGYAIIANVFVQAINETYGANVPGIGLGPFLFGPEASAGTGIGVGLRGFAGAPRLTRRAENQLRFALGVPGRADLRAMLGGGGQGGGGGGGGGGGQGGGGGEDGDGCSLPPGHPKYCDVCGPCGVGEGDCDQRTGQCRDGLTCVDNVGASYGFGPGIDVCERP